MTDDDGFAQVLSEFAIAVHWKESERAKVLSGVLRAMYESRDGGVESALRRLVELRNMDRGSWRGAWAEAFDEASAALNGESE